MIEISHAQARRLLSSALDSRQDDQRRLHEEQWTALLAHLEGCAECRAYEKHLRGLEKNLRRAARSVFDTAPALQDGLPGRVLVLRKTRRTHRRRAASQALALLLTLVLLTDSLGRWVPAAPQAGENAGLAQRAATLLPLAGAGSFPAVIAYEARASAGDSEIFLLNPGSPPDNLTDHPAEDTHPAWSPDGEWLAFLSDRASPGHAEVYVMPLSGDRVVQLTNEPGMVWSGPLSWSADGLSIALTGTRSEAGDLSWIYLVPVNSDDPNNGPAALAGTRGAYAPEFSPAGRRLAYLYSEGERSGVVLHHLVTGEQAKASWVVNPRAASPLPGAQFDWSPDGSGLAYIAADPLAVASLGRLPDSGSGGGGEGGSQVWAVSDLNYSIGLFYEYTRNVRVARSRWPGAYRAVTWSPGGSVVYLEDLDDARAQDQPGQVSLGCQMVQSREPNDTERTYSYGGLCVEGGLDSASWTPDGRWLVVLGRMPDERELSIYALRMPGRGEPALSTPEPDQTSAALAAGEVLRLAGDPRTLSMPRVRPGPALYQPPLSIQPGQASRFDDQPRPSDFGSSQGGPSGHIVYEIQNNNRSVLVSTNPDGTGGQVMLSSAGRLRCPVWSPDGQKLALVARPRDFEGQGDGEELYILDHAGSQPRQMSSAAQAAESQYPQFVDFGCPAWSPDGKSLAALVYQPDEWRIAVVAAHGGTASQNVEQYAAVGRPVLNAPVLWAPDGRSFYLAAAPLEGGRARMVSAHLPESPGGSLDVHFLTWDALPGSIMTYALAPDGDNLMVLVRPEEMRGKVQVWRVPISGVLTPSMLVELDARLPDLPEIRRALMDWSAAQTVQLALTTGPLERYKTLLVRIDLNRDLIQAEPRVIAGVEDTLHSLDWSPDGAWLVLSTEGGLWGVDLHAAAQSLAGPAYLSPVPVADLDWR